MDLDKPLTDRQKWALIGGMAGGAALLALGYWLSETLDMPFVTGGMMGAGVSLLMVSASMYFGLREPKA